MHIASAGNVVVPAYLTILAKGYAVDQIKPNMFRARKGADSYTAEDPVLLLGLIAMGELRGENWHAADDDIEAYLQRFEQN